ncbi:MAG: hypothetical protein Solivirus5_2 [Solivirus sp.]|uniref:Uncharacterized protein n=1 Tax=Solivirus sp. TaxID=2487772 RepID=A0A3G5AHL0_9VIRU|nr:MAG: hypothetical protein Solivirus5_2 [Solivirus sp.]
MEATKLILQHESDLKISWTPGCYYKGEGRWSCGLAGMMGSIGPGAPKRIPIPVTKLPKSLMFIVKSQDEDLLKQIASKASEEKTLKSASVFSQKKIQLRPLRVKEERKEEYERISRENKEQDDAIIDQVHRLVDLGCSDIEYNVNRKPFPSDLYEEFGEIKYDDARLDICCCEDTEIYIALKETGLLEKYFPVWYKNGVHPDFPNEAFTFIEH